MPRRERRTAAQSAVLAVVETAIGPVRLAATDAGLCKIALGEETPESFADWLARHVGPATLNPEASPLPRAVEQLNAYLEGRLRAFDLPLDLHGTPFQQSVWHAVARIPYGQTTTYGQIAAQIGRPNAARAVGAANGANPLPIVIPCHRVVGGNGALRGYGGGLHIKQALLDLERAG
jgi:O-6-methylguanine DNA methyltransferase